MLDEQVHKDTYKLTSNAYDKACKEIGYSNQELKLDYMDSIITREEYIQKAEELDEVYRRILCKLPTSVLNIVLLANDSGQVSRAQKTIDNIATELFERELNKNEKEGTS